MHHRVPSAPRTTGGRPARAVAGAIALALLGATTALGAVPAHADTGTTSGSASTSTDPRYAALAQAASSGQPVTIDSLTTGDSQTQALPDGTLADTTTVQPTRMQNSAGGWEDIDPTLVRNADGTISTTATPNALTLSGGGTGAVITAADGAGHSMALSLPVTLPTPTLSGASATYPAIYPGISLTVTAAPTGGFSEVFQVDNAAAETQAQSLQFTTQLSGLSMSQGSNNTLNVVDTATGQNVMTAPGAIMWDSATTGAAANNVPDDFETVTNADSSTAGPGMGAHTGQLPITDSGSTLTLDGAATQLDTTAPTFPLYLDPTWTEPYQSGGTNNYSEAQAGCPGTANWDDVTQPGVGYNNQDGDGNCPGYGAYESFFDLSTANLNSGDTIVSSTFKINEVYSADYSCGEGTQTVNIQWTGGINQNTAWDSRPAVINTISEPVDHLSLKTDGNSHGTICSGGVVPADFTVTSAINANLGNSHITFGLYGDESGSWESLERFNNNPSIYTVYDIKPNTPTNTIASPTPVDANGAADQACTGSANNPYGYLGISNFGGQHIATLSATLTSSITSAQMYGSFHLWDDSVTGSWTGSSSGFVTTGGTVSWQTPALTDGNLYGWDVTSSDQFYSSLNPSTSCFFRVDQTPPTNPVIASTDFPPLSSTNPGKPTGQSGSITLTASDPAPSTGSASGMHGFYYSFDTPVPANGATLHAATSGTLAVSQSFTTWGTHTLYVQAVDNAGNRSAQSQYTFFVPQGATIADKAGGNLISNGVTDLVTADSAGDLVYYPAGNDPATAPTTLSVPADSPGKDSWSNYQFTHRGNFSQNSNSTSNQSVDDLWAYDTSTGQLYIYKNNGTNPFENPNNWQAVTKAGITTDNGDDVNLPGNTPYLPCYATAETDCAGYQANTTWTGLQQLIATTDLYATDPVSVASSVPFDMLTVESGTLWLYQANNGNPDYLVNPVKLGAPGTSDDWNNYTIIAPGPIGGKPTLWVRDTNKGTIYQYTIIFGKDGYPYPLALPTTSPTGCGTTISCPTSLTVPGASHLSKGADPQITSPGNWSNTSYPDLVATTSTGELIDYPGAAPASGLATFTDPTAVGNPTTGTFTFPSDGAIYPSGSEWTNSKSTLTFQQGQLTLSNTATGAITAQYGTPGNPNAYLVLQTDGNLVIYNDIGSGTPSVLWALSHVAGVTVASGDSMTLHSDGSLTVNSATGTTLWTAATADPNTAPTGPTDIGINTSNGLTVDAATGANLVTGQGLATGTTASIAGLTTGGWEAAFQATNGHLKTIDGTDTITDTGYTMAANTSPSIAPMPNGGWMIAFQGSNTDATTLTSTGAYKDYPMGMEAKTSPSLATNPTGGWEFAVQVNTGALWTQNANGTTHNTGQGMDAGTSPSIVCVTSGVEVAFQANNNYLYTYNADGSVTNMQLGMQAGTSPSIAALPDGTWIAAFEANTNGLWTATPSGGHNLSLGMQAGTSPAITGLTGGTWQVAFQANTGILWTITPSGGTNTGQTMTGNPTITPYQINQAN